MPLPAGTVGSGSGPGALTVRPAVRADSVAPVHRQSLNRAVVRPIAVVAVLVSMVGLAVACGDDSGDDAAASSTTASSTTVDGATSTTLDPGEAAGGDAAVVLTIGGDRVELTQDSCTSEAAGQLSLTAQDSEGNTLTVTATDGAGSAVYRGSSEDREGAARSVVVEQDGTFQVTGIMSVADGDNAPGPEDLTITGTCSG